MKEYYEIKFQDQKGNSGVAEIQAKDVFEAIEKFKEYKSYLKIKSLTVTHLLV